MIDYQIGKNGISDNVISDITSHLKKDKTVRVKFLRSFLESVSRHNAKNTLEKILPVKADFKLVGNVLTISKKQKI